MRLAIAQAEAAIRMNEVPVGAVIISGDNELISTGYNQRETLNDPTAHAEIIAIREASVKLQSWRLTGCTLYVTLEPCIMCAGAIVSSRLPMVVFGACDPKAGAIKSKYNIGQDSLLNHEFGVVEGILGDECGKMLSAFFRMLRE